jgi:mono/diheme cytochrome c family protein
MPAGAPWAWAYRWKASGDIARHQQRRRFHMRDLQNEVRWGRFIAVGVLLSCGLAACTPAAPPSAPEKGGAGGSGRAGLPGGGSPDSGAPPSAGSADRATVNPMDAEAGEVAARPDAGTDVPYSPIPGYAVCVLCHGPEGAGTDKGPEIQHPVLDYSTWVVRNGRMHPTFKEPMPKFTIDQVPDAQLEGIFRFLGMLQKPTSGAGLYKDYCLNCHGADARGGVTMRDISAEPLATFIADSRSGHHAGEFSNRREYMPKWTAAELSDAELRLIFDYVDGL